MNKTELTDKIAAQTGLTKVQAAQAVEAFMEVVVDTVAAGDDVRLIGFGTFAASERAARVGRNPHTGESISIPACRTPKFTAGTAFKAKLK